MSDRDKKFDEKEKKPKRLPQQRVRCPHCWEAFRLGDNDDPDTFLGSHAKKCWWLEKNGHKFRQVTTTTLAAPVPT